MVTRSEFAQESASTRSDMENLKEDLLKALEGIAVQQNAFVTLLTKRAKREAEVFGSKH